MMIFQFFCIFYLFMLKVTSSDDFSYQNKILQYIRNKNMNKNANVAAVIRLTRATKKAQRKKTLYLEGLQWKWDVLELQTSINSRLIYNEIVNIECDFRLVWNTKKYCGRNMGTNFRLKTFFCITAAAPLLLSSLPD